MAASFLPAMISLAISRGVCGEERTGECTSPRSRTWRTCGAGRSLAPPQASRGARCDGERPPRRRLIPAVASPGPPGLRCTGPCRRRVYEELGSVYATMRTESIKKLGQRRARVGQRLLLDQGTRVHQPRMCPDNCLCRSLHQWVTRFTLILRVSCGTGDS